MRSRAKILLLPSIYLNIKIVWMFGLTCVENFDWIFLHILETLFSGSIIIHQKRKLKHKFRNIQQNYTTPETHIYTEMINYFYSKAILWINNENKFIIKQKQTNKQTLTNYNSHSYTSVHVELKCCYLVNFYENVNNRKAKN